MPSYHDVTKFTPSNSKYGTFKSQKANVAEVRTPAELKLNETQTGVTPELVPNQINSQSINESPNAKPHVRTGTGSNIHNSHNPHISWE